MAGSTSTALCITFMFAYLCNNPSQLKRLQAEVDNCWDGKSVLEVSKIGKITRTLIPFSDLTSIGPAAAPFLQGCIEESLRIWPPAPAGMQRRSPMEDILVDGKVVPSNTFISVTPFAAQRDSKNFSKPLDFMPERWIDAERPASYNHDVRAFIPFTVGQFACLGKNLAYQEIRRTCFFCVLISLALTVNLTF
jgi:cytochrome P450